MARLPFNPDRVAAPDAGPPARRERKPADGSGSASSGGSAGSGGKQPLTVEQVCQMVKRVLADGVPGSIRVVGEVSNFSDRRHWFLSLKDDKSVLGCVMWASAARKCGFTPERGQQVVATGRLDYYGPQGKLQMYIDRLEPVGQGALELQLRQLCDELRKQGYFEEDRKKPLPVFPTHIAVVTSRSGAALHDVERTARQRWPGVRLSLVDVRVQGAAAAPEVAAAVRALSEGHGAHGIDAIILTRGGGSLEDLWAFNEREVADAVYHCRVPTIAAIGHETDTTVAELVADLRCSTPTQAAARLVPDTAAERERLDQLGSRLTMSLRRRASHARERLEALARHPLFRRPTEPIHRHRETLGHLQNQLTAAVRGRLGHLRERLSGLRHELGRIEPEGRLRLARYRLDELTQRLGRATEQELAERRRRVDALERELRAIGPEQVLRRGYSYTTDQDGRVIRSVREVGPGDRVVSHLMDGQVGSRVEGDEAPDDAAAADGSASKAGAKAGSKKRGRKSGQRNGQRKGGSRSKAADGTEPSLFEQNAQNDQ